MAGRDALYLAVSWSTLDQFDFQRNTSLRVLVLHVQLGTNNRSKLNSNKPFSSAACFDVRLQQGFVQEMANKINWFGHHMKQAVRQIHVGSMNTGIQQSASQRGFEDFIDAMSSAVSPASRLTGVQYRNASKLWTSY